MHIAKNVMYSSSQVNARDAASCESAPSVPRSAIFATFAMRSLAPPVLALAMALLFGACAARKPAPSEPERITLAFVRLVSGPNSGKGEPEARRALFQGHMANINRLAGEGVIIIAGPYDKPVDRAWRGVFVMDLADEQQVLSQCKTDPAVAAGEFTPVVTLIRCSPALRDAPALERARAAREAARAASTDAQHDASPKGIPPGMHRYAFVTALDAPKAAEWLVREGVRVVWRGDHASSREGLLVTDADPAALRERWQSTRTESDPIASVDGWWGASSLLDLPPSAGN